MNFVYTRVLFAPRRRCRVAAAAQRVTLMMMMVMTATAAARPSVSSLRRLRRIERMHKIVAAATYINIRALQLKSNLNVSEHLPDERKEEKRIEIRPDAATKPTKLKEKRSARMHRRNSVQKNRNHFAVSAVKMYMLEASWNVRSSGLRIHFYSFTYDFIRAETSISVEIHTFREALWEYIRVAYTMYCESKIISSRFSFRFFRSHFVFRPALVCLVEIDFCHI